MVMGTRHGLLCIQADAMKKIFKTLNSKILKNIYLTGALIACVVCLDCLTEQAKGNPSSNLQNIPVDNTPSTQRLNKPVKYLLPKTSSSLNSSGDEDYILGTGDLIQINVLGSDEFNTKVRIPQSGYVSMPFIGSILASGLNISELEFNITDILSKDYLQEPQVTVFVDEYNSKKIFVVGNVESPQVVKLKENKSTLLEIISMVGGFKENTGEVIYVIRPFRGFDPSRPSDNITDAEEETHDSSNDFDASDIDAGSVNNLNDDMILKTMDEITIIRKDDLINYRNPNGNIDIYQNDIISVPIADFCFVMGEVENPGAYQMKPDMTVLQAVSMSGRFSETSNLRELRIIRKNLATNEEYIVKVNLKKLLKGKGKSLIARSGDIYIIGESPLKKLAMQTKLFTQIAFSAFTNAFAWDAIRSGN